MMQAVIPHAGTGTDRAARSSQPGRGGSRPGLGCADSARPPEADAETVTTRLAAEFSALSRGTVERWVWETWMCAEHLGLPVTGGLVERIAREHLHGVQKSVPPSPR